MFTTVLTWILVVKCLAALLCCIRIFKGPTNADRIAGLDTLGLLLIGFVAVLMMIQDTLAYTEIVLVIGILAFIGSISLAKFMERGNLFDRE